MSRSLKRGLDSRLLEFFNFLKFSQLFEFFIDYLNDRDESERYVHCNNHEVAVLPSPFFLSEANDKLPSSCTKSTCAIDNSSHC